MKELSPIAAEGDVRDDVDLLACIGEGALERPVVARRDDDLEWHPAITQVPRQRSERAVHRTRRVLARVQLVKLVVERADTVRHGDELRDARQARSTGRRVVEGLREVRRRGCRVRRCRGRRDGLRTEHGYEPGGEKRADDLRVTVGMRLQRAGAGGGRLERRIVAQDSSVELLELLPRQQPDLVEEAAALVKGGVCLDVPARLVEREHQVAHQLLAVTVLSHEALELGDHRGVPAEREVGADPVLERAQPKPCETADLVGDARLEREVRERLAELFERGQVELLGAGVDRVTGRTVHDHVGPEQPS